VTYSSRGAGTKFLLNRPSFLKLLPAGSRPKKHIWGQLDNY